MTSPLLPPLETDIAPLTTVLVSYNTRHLLDACLDALKAAADPLGAAPVIVVDNASRDDSVAHLRARHADVHLIVSESNLGFGRANNLALPHLRSRYVLLLNTDAFVERTTLTATLDYMDAHPRCGILGVRLVGRDGNEQPSCRSFPTPFRLFSVKTGLSRWLPPAWQIDGAGLVPAQPTRCDWVPGCYYLVRREVIAQIGLFDPRYFLYFEEVDHCFAARRAGWDVVCLPTTTVVHVGGESAKSDGPITAGGRQLARIEFESALLYFRKNLGLWAAARHVLLDGTADLALAAKALLKGRQRRARCADQLRHLALIASATLATRLGRRGTR